MGVRDKVGIVVSDKMRDSCIVAVNNRVIHKKYRKVITTTKRYVVHDDTLHVSVGDKVRFCSVKPMSKTKNCSLTGVLRKSET
jgi:small subunit ribosomal protein S17